MSAFRPRMSALLLKADIEERDHDVRFGPEADIAVSALALLWLLGAGRQRVDAVRYDAYENQCFKPMRSLTKNLRTRAAIFIVLAYAVCALAPSAALAFADNPKAFHCLAELNGMTTAVAEHETVVHAHADGIVHHHDQSGMSDKYSGTDNKSHAGNCCGLFCVSALAHDPGLTFGVDTPASPALPTVANGLAGCGPNLLHRPPIT